MSKHRAFKTPNQRRINKWRKRVFRLIQRGPDRGFLWFMYEMRRCLPLIAAAKVAGVDLAREVSACYGGPVDEEALMAFILGPRFEQFATRRNLEI